MWRWLGGSECGGEKRAKAGGDVVESEVTVKKKQRTFNPKWLGGREWLVFDTERDIMYCSDCRIYTKEKNRTNHFVIGTRNFKVETVKDHESSQSHLETARMEETVAAKSLVSMKASQLHKMELLFRNAHAIGKKGRPFTDFTRTCEKVKKKSFNFLITI